MKIGLSIWDSNIDKIDEIRKQRQLTRSALVNMVLQDYFESLEVAKRENDRLQVLAQTLLDLSKGDITADEYRSKVSDLMQK